MKNRTLAMLAVAAMTALTLAANAEDAVKPKTMAKLKTQSWTGEIVDMGCYVSNDAKGEKHKECGTKCVANGMPMGLLTKDGKVQLLTMDHDNPDPYNDCKKWVDQMVEVSGTLASRGGVSAIDVQGAKPVAAAPAGK